MPSVAQLPVTPPVGNVPHVQITEHDLAHLEELTASHSEPYLHSHPKSQSWRRRDAPLDPLLFAAAAASGPHVTRHHYHHDFFPEPELDGEEIWDWSQWTGGEKEALEQPPRYVSKQAPRSQRLKEDGPHHTSISVPVPELEADDQSRSAVNFTPPAFNLADPQVQVQCLSRARIPTPHGQAFLHLYRNNRDNKEHLAIVVDSAQLEDPPRHTDVPPIRSRSLDATWSAAESDRDRIVRGAYVGRLTSTVRTPSLSSSRAAVQGPPPLVRIHSECFTGETIGSLRCDCGEQLDEALRLISAHPGRGVIVYMRQEGRGIGLLSKLRAYNLQDMGHDTVTANLMLGHGADERGYEVAGAILRDLGAERGVRLLTNNPDKVQALQNEGVRIVERVPMVPRSWQCRPGHPHAEGAERIAGATMIGGSAAHGEELEKYLRTKVDRMGHMLTLPPPSAH